MTEKIKLIGSYEEYLKKEAEMSLLIIKIRSYINHLSELDASILEYRRQLNMTLIESGEGK